MSNHRSPGHPLALPTQPFRKIRCVGTPTLPRACADVADRVALEFVELCYLRRLGLEPIDVEDVCFDGEVETSRELVLPCGPWFGGHHLACESNGSEPQRQGGDREQRPEAEKARVSGGHRSHLALSDGGTRT